MPTREPIKPTDPPRPAHLPADDRPERPVRPTHPIAEPDPPKPGPHDDPPTH